MKMNKIIYRSLSVTIFLFLLTSCNDTKWKAQDPESTETMNSGKISYVLDESISDVIDSTIIMYDTQYENVILTGKTANSRVAMAELLEGKVRVAISARSYLKDEDSLMKEFNLSKHKRLKAAIDALVLCVNKDFPLDTINANDLESILTENKDINDFYPSVSKGLPFYSKDQNSSEWGNILNLMGKGKEIKKPFRRINNKDSLVDIAINGEGFVFTYLSNVVKNENVKMLRIGYQDSTDKYINPKPVHQGWIVQGLYPYKVDYWVYLLEDRNNLPYWFASYLAKETKVQKYFLDQGIVPAFAKVKLRPQ